jgi:hypothetical protein
MKRIPSIVPVLVLLAAAAAGAQEKPNLAGTWKLSEPAQPEMFMASRIVISQDTSNLTVVATNEMGEFTTIYKLDGSAGRSPLDFNGMTIDRMTKLTWNDNKLTLTTSSEMNGQVTEFKSVMSLRPDGALAVESTFPDFQGGGPPITQKAVYKK